MSIKALVSILSVAVITSTVIAPANASRPMKAILQGPIMISMAGLNISPKERFKLATKLSSEAIFKMEYMNVLDDITEASARAAAARAQEKAPFAVKATKNRSKF